MDLSTTKSVSGRSFLSEDFLLPNEYSRRLYHEWVEHLPIIDYHCHLSPSDIAEDTTFANLTRIWLDGDHYKWRAMRTNGVEEKFCTGDACDWDKFLKWSETVPKTLRNPLFHWTHLELRRPFGISDCLLNPSSAEKIWNRCNEMLNSPGFSARGILSRMNVKVVCTTDDPTDTLTSHISIFKENFSIQVRPTWRPDKGMAIESPEKFNLWIRNLEIVTKIPVRTYDNYLQALSARHDFFHDVGCRLSDHGIDTVYAADYSYSSICSIFSKVRSGVIPTVTEANQFKSAMLYEWAIMDHRRSWVQQYHIGALRNNNSKMLKRLGPDRGFDSIGDLSYANALAQLLDRLDATDQLTRTIIYNINPRDNEMIATMVGNFQDGTIPGKIQFGSGWWFLDQKEGIERHLEAVSNMSLLSQFVGMVTDSRSFLSFTRHEYFRRILCSKLGKDMETGMVPDDFDLVGNLVKDICYLNATRYFDFGLKPSSTL